MAELNCRPIFRCNCRFCSTPTVTQQNLASGTEARERTHALPSQTLVVVLDGASDRVSTTCVLSDQHFTRDSWRLFEELDTWFYLLVASSQLSRLFQSNNVMP